MDHVDELTDTTRFRLITFCNQAYWPFSHNMRESLKVVGPTLLPFWTIIVADKATKEFIQREAPEVDVFVDEDLESLVASSQVREHPPHVPHAARLLLSLSVIFPTQDATREWLHTQ